MKLFSYIVTQDAGFAPNPFWGYCTLACCKPTIRRTSQKGDWIVGLSPKGKGHKIIYVMQVDETLSFEDYYRDKRFTDKIPVNYSDGKNEKECGDNIYKPLRSKPLGYKDFKQHKSNHKPRDKKHDIMSGKKVLISKKFYYFGKEAIKLPPRLWDLKVGRGHKNRFPEHVIKKFLSYITKQKRGLCAKPTTWDKGKHSFKEGNSCGLS